MAILYHIFIPATSTAWYIHPNFRHQSRPCLSSSVPEELATDFRRRNSSVTWNTLFPQCSRSLAGVHFKMGILAHVSPPHGKTVPSRLATEKISKFSVVTESYHVSHSLHWRRCAPTNYQLLTNQQTAPTRGARAPYTEGLTSLHGKSSFAKATEDKNDFPSWVRSDATER